MQAYGKEFARYTRLVIWLGVPVEKRRTFKTT